MSVKIDLVTGFLGSGKTTFIRNYVRYLVSKGERIGILENDYGAVNVDMMLLSDLRSDKVEIEMIAGGCDYDCHVRRFKTKLISMAMSGYNRVIVEPSGIFDTDEFFDLVYEEPLDSWYEIGNVITLADANIRIDNPDSLYLFASQLASAGIVIFSRSEGHKREDLLKILNDSMEKLGCIRRFDSDVILGNYSNFSDDEFEMISHSGYHSYSYEKRQVMEDNSYSSLYFMDMGLKRKTIEELALKLFQDESYGNIIRVKGFFLNQGKWYLINVTKDSSDLDEISLGQDVLIIIGENIKEDKIKNLLSLL